MKPASENGNETNQAPEDGSPPHASGLATGALAESSDASQYLDALLEAHEGERVRGLSHPVVIGRSGRGFRRYVRTAGTLTHEILNLPCSHGARTLTVA